MSFTTMCKKYQELGAQSAETLKNRDKYESGPKFVLPTLLSYQFC